MRLKVVFQGCLAEPPPYTAPAQPPATAGCTFRIWKTIQQQKRSRTLFFFVQFQAGSCRLSVYFYFFFCL